MRGKQTGSLRALNNRNIRTNSAHWSVAGPDATAGSSASAGGSNPTSFDGSSRSSAGNHWPNSLRLQTTRPWSANSVGYLAIRPPAAHHSDYRQLTRYLASELSRDDRISLAILLGLPLRSEFDVFPDAEIIRELERRGVLGPEFTEFLSIVLAEIGRNDLAHQVSDYSSSHRQLEMPLPEINMYRRLLFQVAQDIGPSTHEFAMTMNMALPSYPGYMTPLEQNLRTLRIMEQRGMIGPTALESLLEALKSMYRPTQHVESYMDTTYDNGAGQQSARVSNDLQFMSHIADQLSHEDLERIAYLLDLPLASAALASNNQDTLRLMMVGVLERMNAARLFEVLSVIGRNDLARQVNENQHEHFQNGQSEPTIDPLRRLLLSIADELGGNERMQLAFLGSLPWSIVDNATKLSSIRILIELERHGVFSATSLGTLGKMLHVIPYNCEHLAKRVEDYIAKNPQTGRQGLAIDTFRQLLLQVAYDIGQSTHAFAMTMNVALPSYPGHMTPLEQNLRTLRMMEQRGMIGPTALESLLEALKSMNLPTQHIESYMDTTYDNGAGQQSARVSNDLQFMSHIADQLSHEDLERIAYLLDLPLASAALASNNQDTLRRMMVGVLERMNAARLFEFLSVIGRNDLARQVNENQHEHFQNGQSEPTIDPLRRLLLSVVDELDASRRMQLAFLGSLPWSIVDHAHQLSSTRTLIELERHGVFNATSLGTLGPLLRALLNCQHLAERVEDYIARNPQTGRQGLAIDPFRRLLFQVACGIGGSNSMFVMTMNMTLPQYVVGMPPIEQNLRALWMMEQRGMIGPTALESLLEALKSMERREAWLQVESYMEASNEKTSGPMFMRVIPGMTCHRI